MYYLLDKLNITEFETFLFNRNRICLSNHIEKRNNKPKCPCFFKDDILSLFFLIVQNIELHLLMNRKNQSVMYTRKEIHFIIKNVVFFYNSVSLEVYISTLLLNNCVLYTIINLQKTFTMCFSYCYIICFGVF